MNLKKILRTGLIAIGLSTLALNPLTAQDATSLVKKLNPESLMVIVTNQAEDGKIVIDLHYNVDGDDLSDSVARYNFMNVPNENTILKLKECYHDLDENGVFDSYEKSVPEINYDRDLSVKNPVDFLKQLDPRFLVAIQGEEKFPGISLYYNLSEGKESAKVIYEYEHSEQDQNVMFVRLLGYQIDLNNDGEYGEGETFLVEYKSLEQRPLKQQSI